MFVKNIFLIILFITAFSCSSDEEENPLIDPSKDSCIRLINDDYPSERSICYCFYDENNNLIDSMNLWFMTTEASFRTLDET